MQKPHIWLMMLVEEASTEQRRFLVRQGSRRSRFLPFGRPFLAALGRRFLDDTAFLELLHDLSHQRKRLYETGEVP